LIALPTALRLPKFGSAFLVTHRFTRPLGSGDFGDLAADFFGMDTGAQIGLEYRFGIIPSGQIGILRTSDREIEFFAEYGIFRQGSGRPFEVMALASIEGGDNFKDAKSPALGVIVSRRAGDFAAFYVEPIWVNNSNPLPSEIVDDNDSFLLGVGGRFRVSRTVYVVVEAAPRVAGYDPDTTHWTVGVEKLVGGHLFQINVSNGVGTTISQLARGGLSDDTFLGFNITRKFWR
jgi:uncharacterized beta barrel domain-containing protein DUF5777